MQKKLTYHGLFLLYMGSIVPAWGSTSSNDTPTQACIKEIVQNIKASNLKNDAYSPNQDTTSPIDKNKSLVNKNLHLLKLLHHLLPTMLKMGSASGQEEKSEDDDVIYTFNWEDKTQVENLQGNVSSIFANHFNGDEKIGSILEEGYIESDTVLEKFELLSILIHYRAGDMTLKTFLDRISGKNQATLDAYKINLRDKITSSNLKDNSFINEHPNLARLLLLNLLNKRGLFHSASTQPVKASDFTNLTTSQHIDQFHDFFNKSFDVGKNSSATIFDCSSGNYKQKDSVNLTFFRYLLEDIARNLTVNELLSKIDESTTSHTGWSTKQKLGGVFIMLVFISLVVWSLNKKEEENKHKKQSKASTKEQSVEKDEQNTEKDKKSVEKDSTSGSS